MPSLLIPCDAQPMVTSEYECRTQTALQQSDLLHHWFPWPDWRIGAVSFSQDSMDCADQSVTSSINMTMCRQQWLIGMLVDCPKHTYLRISTLSYQFIDFHRAVWSIPADSSMPHQWPNLQSSLNQHIQRRYSNWIGDLIQRTHPSYP